ncbi:peptidylprolyl isomerase [Candidatus Pelagibacter giovannonii]|uniref:Parvulin-like PPIase n=1 Tax=Candidatus Pelagibacter giovannonii TaxID=2563896 RepID=A0A6H1Q1S6_9PROT|nr:peptidylprolyl isomerase [Candidatus Pelagibacter giovannonii]QIZ20656.1 peptidylprolyl isomerase [Candidatus Pelagibacter giovannonii]
MKKKNLIFLFFLVFIQVQAIETKIIHSIQNEIITNIDIKNEFKYLLALNSSLKELDEEKILSISNESAIREKIKKIEILKNFKELKLNEDYSEHLLKNIYSRLNLKSINEFEKYLKNYDLKISDIKTKIIIDALWNELIIKKYGSKVTINETAIKKEILKNSKIQTKEYQLSEIIFEVATKDEIKKKYKEIVKSINEIGFENSAVMYSFSESAKIGGDIGWINENSLNENIRKNINILQVGEFTKPIILSNGILIIKLINTKNSETTIDTENELKKAINYERNRQLNQYSKIYYNKIKKNLDFNG